MNAPPVWIGARAILFLYDASLAMFGGARGLRDGGLLEFALARSLNQHLYKPDGDISELAAAYAFGHAKNHPFVDGNERTTPSFSLGLFLAINGWRFERSQIDAIETMLSLAMGRLDECSLAGWIRGGIVCEK